jgi:hypothetical protein
MFHDEYVTTSYTPLTLAAVPAVLLVTTAVVFLQTRWPARHSAKGWCVAAAALLLLWLTPFAFGWLAPGKASKAVRSGGDFEHVPGLLGAGVVAAMTTAILYGWFAALREGEEEGEEEGDA